MERYSYFVVWTMIIVLMVQEIESHPLLVECYCDVTLEDINVITLDDNNVEDDEGVVKVPDCLGDVFAESGIRWVLNGPYNPNIAYSRLEGRVYTTERAAMRLTRFGYKCMGYQLLDPNEDIAIV